MIDVRDESGERTGAVVWKSEAHRRGLWHRCFHCWICTPATDDGGPFLLAQRRAAEKDIWPGYLDVTAAGHLAAGEDPLDGLREVEEELGLRVDPIRLVPLGTRRVELEIPVGMDRELYDVFLVLDDTDPGDFRLQREEVEAILRLDLDDIGALGSAGSVPAREYPAGAPFDTRVGPEDFVPYTDDYLRQVSQAARQLLAGERPGRIFQSGRTSARTKS